MDTCPSFSDLKRWLAEELPAQEQEHVALHLSDCDFCQKALDGLTGLELPTPAREDHSQQRKILSHLQQLLKPVDSDTGEESNLAVTTGFDPTTTPTRVDLENYEMLEELGRGGMGVVYKARDVRLDRLVALKMILHGSSSTPEHRLRFEREARAIARLDHPNIVQIYEIGKHQDHPFFSLEFVTGGSLAQKLLKQPMAPMEAAQLVEALAHGIEAAHQEGVIHRDLKPANILLTESRLPKITDFGLAKQLDLEGNTSTGAIMGTPAYMAPEQVGRKTADITPAVDVHALGAILFECLTGEPPFKATTQVDAILKVVSQEVSFPAPLRSSLPRELQIICLKCLEKDVHRRYISASALAEDLRRFQNHEPISARPVGRVERAWRWCKRNPFVATLLMVVFVVLLSATSISTYYYLNEKTARERESEAKRQALQLATEKTKLAEEKDAALIQARLAQEKSEREHENTKRVAYAYQLNDARQLAEKGDMDRARGTLQNTDSLLRGWEYDLVYRLTYPDKDFAVELQGHSPRSNVISVAFGPTGRILVSNSSGPQGEVFVWDTVQKKSILTIPKSSPSDLLQVVLSSDGTTLATGGANGKLQLWDLKTRKLLHTLQGHSGRVQSAAFGPNGSFLVTGSADKTAKVWDVSSGTLKHSFEDHKFPVFAVAVSPDGQYVASGTGAARIPRRPPGTRRIVFPGNINIWELHTGKIVHQIQHPHPVSQLAFNPNGRQVLSAGGTIKLWDLKTGKESCTFPKQLKWAFSPDGRTIATSGPDSEKVWSTETGKELITLRGETHQLQSLAFTPNGKRIVGSIPALGLKIWDPETGEELLTWTPSTHLVGTIALSPDGTRIASGIVGEGLVSIIGTTTGQNVFTLRGHRRTILSVHLTNDGTEVTSVDSDGEVITWDARTQEVKSRFQTETSPSHAAFAPDGKWLVLGGSRKRKLAVWSMTDQKRKWMVQGDAFQVTGIAFSPDSKQFACAGELRTVKVWDVQTGKEQRTLQLERRMQSATFSPDGRFLAIALAGNKEIPVWDLQTNKELFLLDGTGFLFTIEFSPDGRFLVTGNHKGQVFVWDVKRREVIKTLEISGRATYFAFSANGRYLAGASTSRGVTLWETDTWNVIDSLEAHFAPVRCLAFSKDGQKLITGSEDFNVKLWDLDVLEVNAGLHQ